jgi:hypothetical protein
MTKSIEVGVDYIVSIEEIKVAPQETLLGDMKKEL